MNAPTPAGIPRVSVIIPAYNMGGFIGETLDSVLGQVGVDDFEVLVVDDRSKDDTAAVVEEVARRDDRVRLLRNQGPQGAAGARNHGLQHARGEWVGFVDGDDLWMPDNLRLKLDAAATHPGLRLVSSDYYNENRANRSVPRTEWDGLRQSLTPAWQRHVGAPGASATVQVIDGLTARFLADEVLGHTGTFLVRRDAIEAVGGFDTTLEVGEDVYLWLQLAERERRMIFVHQPLMFYRYRAGSLTNQGYPAHAFNAERLLGYLATQPAFSAHGPLIRQRLLVALLQQCYYLRRVRRFGAAAGAVWKMLRLHPGHGPAWRNLAAIAARR